MSRLLLVLALLLSATAPSLAQGAGGRPPANVTTATIRTGTVAPHFTFIGTVTYPEIAEVAAEADGRVARVHFEEGGRVGEGDELVSLDAAVLRQEIEALGVSRNQAVVEAKKVKLEEERFQFLFDQGNVSRQEYEDRLYGSQALALRAEALEAQVDVLKAQLAKKSVYAPFAGVVLERKTERGEWVDPGTVVAELARDDQVDIIVNVSADALASLDRGEEVEFEVGGRRGRGRVEAVIPKGDVRTRTFPVKVRAPNERRLLAGMEARVWLPTGPARKVTIVPRDAVVTVQGRETVYTVADGAARAVPVEVVGYQGRTAGVIGEGLAEGAPVVVKGNERLQDGQPVQVLP